jgi:alanine dehydrogenase
MKNHGLPTIQGAIIVCDADNGRLLALMDSIEITIIRTGAATGVAAKYLAKKNSRIMTIYGCGNQGRISLKAITAVRELHKVYVYDSDAEQMNKFVHELSEEIDIPIVPVTNINDALMKSDIIVTCTPSKKPFLAKKHIKPGAFIAAVGSDNEDKNELEPLLISAGKLITDITEQCATIGELHHALENGTMKRGDVHGELGEVIAGLKPGRLSDEEIIIFDSTGTALQDVAAAAIVYEKSIASEVGIKLNFAD